MRKCQHLYASTLVVLENQSARRRGGGCSTASRWQSLNLKAAAAASSVRPPSRSAPFAILVTHILHPLSPRGAVARLPPSLPLSPPRPPLGRAAARRNDIRMTRPVERVPLNGRPEVASDFLGPLKKRAEPRWTSVCHEATDDRRCEPSAGRGRAGRFLVWRLSLLRVTVRRSMEPAIWVPQ